MSIQELTNRRDVLRAEMAETYARESVLKMECSTILPKAEYDKKRLEFTAIHAQRARLLHEKAEIKAELARLICENDKARMESKEKPAEVNSDVRGKLVQLRNKWQGFASDQTRVASMRLMANQFLDDLRPILRTLFNEQQ